MPAIRTLCVALVSASLALLCHGGAIASGSIATVYVNQSASGVADGKSWSTAFRTVQEGLDHAQDGGEVWVAAGTYPEMVTFNVSAKAYGGFAGNETDVSQRNPAAHATVLTGDKTASVVTIPDFVSDVKLDGFTIQNGGGLKGRGIRNEAARTTISSNLITANHGNAVSPDTTPCLGGGIWSGGASPRIIGNSITLNGAGGGTGGGVFCSGSDVLIYRNAITLNGAGGGGGIAFEASSGRIADNIVEGNSAASELFGGRGGGISANVNAVIVNNTIIRNFAGGVWSQFADPAHGGGLIGGGTVENNVVAFNTLNGGMGGGEIGPNVATDPSGVSHNIIYGGTSHGAVSAFADSDYSSNNIIASPAFVDRFALDYRLQPGSPAVDAGDDMVVMPGDLDYPGNPRIGGLHVDIGAYEYAAVQVGTGPFAMSDVVRALRVAGGLEYGNYFDIARLDVVKGASIGRIDVADAVALARKVRGLDANP